MYFNTLHCHMFVLKSKLCLNVTRVHTHTYIYIYIYICVCVYLCMLFQQIKYFHNISTSIKSNMIFIKKELYSPNELQLLNCFIIFRMTLIRKLNHKCERLTTVWGHRHSTRTIGGTPRRGASNCPDGAMLPPTKIQKTCLQLYWWRMVQGLGSDHVINQSLANPQPMEFGGG